MDNRSDISSLIRRIERGDISREQGVEWLKSLRRKTAASTPAPLLERVYYVPEWGPAAETGVEDCNSRPTGLLLLIDSDDSLFRSLEAAHLFDRRILAVPGPRFERVSTTHYVINPSSCSDYEQLFDELDREGIGGGPVTVVHALLKECFSPEAADIERQLELGLHALVNMSQAWMRRRSSETVHLMSVYAGRDEEGTHPIHQALTGYMRTLVQEEPSFSCTMLDVRAEPLLTALRNQWRCTPNSGTAVEVRYESGRPHVRTYTGLPFESRNDYPGATLAKNGVYLIAGGMGGIGYELAQHLAGNVQAKLILAGRSPASRQTEERLQQLRTLGGDAVYIQADLTDTASVASLVEQGRAAFGPIQGVFQCAGVLNDSYIRTKNKEQMASVLAPKVFGTVNLDLATRGEPLRMFVIYSSVSAVAGNSGQSDYSFANAFQDEYAGWRAESDAPGQSISINWPLWSGTGMDMHPDMVSHMRAATGMMPLPVQEGMGMLHDALASGSARLVALYGDGGKIRESFQAGAAPSVRETSEQAVMLERMSPSDDEVITGNAAPRVSEDAMERLVSMLKSVFARTIKMKPQLIDVQESFDAYGVDSIAAVSVIRELEKTFGPLSKTLMFEHQTLEALAEYLIAKHQDKMSKLFRAEEQKECRTEQAEQPSSPAVRNAAASGPNRPASAAERPIVSAQTEHPGTDIAIIGLAGRYPQADNTSQFWLNLKAGLDCVTEIPEERWNYRQWYSADRNDKSRTHSKWGGFLDGVDQFDPLFFQIAPREAVYIDPQERLFLETAWRTIEDACYTRDKLSRSKVGVFVGVMYGQYELFGAEETLKGNPMALSSSFASIANRVSYFFKLSGPSMAVDTMCSSSLTAIHLACDSIRKGESEMAIAGGVNLSLHVNKYLMLSQGNFVASDGRCRSFGEGGDGYVPGEGVGAVLLKPLRQAEADGDRIYGVIKGSAINHGGRSNGYTVPNPNAQAEVMKEAYRRAQVDPSTISYVEAHGTGTSLGDPIELAGLVRVFGSRPGEQRCALGSVKSNIGHLESAAGMAALTKVLLQMKHKQLVPSIHAETVNPNLDLEASPFRLQRSLSDWEPAVDNGRALPRRAAISSFGAGGSNAHLIVEEYEADSSAMEMDSTDQTPQLIVLSAPDRSGLAGYAESLNQYLREQKGSPAKEALDAGDAAADIRKELHAAACEAAQCDLLAEERESWEEYGLDPLTLAAMAEQLNARYDLELAPSVFEQHRTVESLAVHIARRRDGAHLLRAQGPVETENPSFRLADFAYTLQLGREEMQERLAFVVDSVEDCIAKLEAYVQGNYDQELYTGSSADQRFAFLNGDEAFEGVIESWLSRRKLDKLAEAWVNGSPIEWGRLLRASAVRFTELSGYPFQKERYWFQPSQQSQLPNGAELNRDSRAGAPKQLHPFIDSNESDVTGLRFRSVLDAEAEYISGYRLAGQRAGSPAVGLELLRAAGEFAAGHPVRRMDNVRWSGCLQALSSGEAIRTRLYPRQSGIIAAEAENDGLPEGERIFVQAELHVESGEEAARAVDIIRIADEIAGKLATSAGGFFMKGADYYEQLEEKRASLKSVYGVIEQAVAYDQKVLLTVRSGHNSAEHDSAGSIVLVPEMIESAFQAAAILHARQSGARDDVYYMPMAVSGIQILQPSSACRYVYASRMPAMSGQSEQLDVLLTDEYGNVLVSLEGIELAPVLMEGAVGGGIRPAVLQSNTAANQAQAVRENAEASLLYKLKRLLADELQINDDRISDNASFMNLGMDSILIAELVPKVERMIGTRMEPSAFLEHPSLNELTAHLQRMQPQADGGRVELADVRELEEEAGQLEQTTNQHLTESNEGTAPVLAERRILTAHKQVAEPEQQFPAGTRIQSESKRIAVIGMACQFPGAPDKETYWSNLASGTCSIAEVPSERWDARKFYSPQYERGKSISKWGGFIRDIELFDPDYFKLSEDEAYQMDPNIRKMMEVTADLLRDAGYEEEELWGRRVGVFVGTRIGPFQIPQDKLTKSAITGLGQNFAAAQLSHYFNFKGPSIVVDTACSSSLVSVHLACQSLLTDESEVAVAGGVELNFDQNPFLLLSEGKALSPDGIIHCFDEKANGFVLGEGCGAVMLKRLEQAVADGDRIYAVIDGAAINNDGRTMGITTPNPEAQCDVILEAYRRSGVSPETISYLEAHGTGTMIGDPIELKALGKAFRSVTSEKQFCAIGSVKTNIGHLLSAAGVASLIKVALSIHHGQIPGTLHCEKPNPRFAFSESPFYPNQSLKEWKPCHGVRRAGISSFGFGGTNAHLIVSGYESASGTVVRTALPPVRFHKRRYWLERNSREEAAISVWVQPIGSIEEKPKAAWESRPLGSIQEEPQVAVKSHPIGSIQEEPQVPARGRPIGIIMEDPSAQYAHDRPYSPMLQIMLE